jgi:recombination protein RecA
MSSLKSHLQSVVAAKVPEAFAFKPSPFELMPTGILQLDSLIHGFQRGGLTEIYGPVSSGRTTIAISFMAEMTHQQEVCAIVDVFDSLDPASLAAAGIDLNRVLWVRCGKPQSGDSMPLAAKAKSKLDQSQHSSSSLTTHQPLLLSSRHPRKEAHGLSYAVANLMGGVSRNFREHAPLTKDGSNREQTSIDRLPPRRGDTVLAKSSGVSGEKQSQSDRFSARLTRLTTATEKTGTPARDLADNPTPWTRLEQALKATDLLLHNGGFGAVVLDLGDVPPANARRIPLASWFRFRRAVENTPTAFILLTREPCAQTCASMELRCERCSERWGSATGSSNAEFEILTLDGLNLEVEVVRLRRGHRGTEGQRKMKIWTQITQI